MKSIKHIDEFINESRDFTFVSDEGPDPIVFKISGRKDIKIPRYGVWTTKGQKKLSVVDSDENLDVLLKKYNLTSDDVYVMDRENFRYVNKEGKEVKGRL